jgi:anaerobic selenocysteine-containing dehydrogenase
MDLFMNPTAELADVVLPAALWPEVDCLFAMPEFADQVLLSQRKCVQVGECKSDEEVILELCRRAGWNYGFTDQRDMLAGQLAELKRRRPEYESLSLEQLRQQGYLAPQRRYRRYQEQGFDTPTGKFELASTALEQAGLDPLPSWHEPPETPVAAPELNQTYPLVLTTGGRQQPFFISNNRQIRSLRKLAPFPLVRLHPDTARRYGIQEGDWVWIENQRGRITQKAKLEPKMDPRVVNCDFGWWYPEAGAPEYGWKESNANLLTSAAPPYDRYLGSYQLRALLCKVYPNPDCTIEQRYQAWLQKGE